MGAAPASALGLGRSNLWVYPDHDHDGNVARYSADRDGQWNYYSFIPTPSGSVMPRPEETASGMSIDLAWRLTIGDLATEHRVNRLGGCNIGNQQPALNVCRLSNRRPQDLGRLLVEGLRAVASAREDPG